MDDLSFYRGKRILITGHTGFKGAWLCKLLLGAGASVTGYALEPPTVPNLFSAANIKKDINSVVGDIRDFEHLNKVFVAARPDVVFHLAAQPLVRDGYKHPQYTYETNVMGTVNLLECIRTAKNPPRSVVNITTDKVYLNRECLRGYRENEPLDGFDPYSNSKSCSELVTHSYKNSFFADDAVAISTARAGNVIGGGDFAADRIIPDCVRAVQAGKPIVVRNPNSIRPYQHVLEPLCAYLMIARKQYDDGKYADCYNVGPNECDCVETGTLVDLFCKYWGQGANRVDKAVDGPHEASFLKLDCSKLKLAFGWEPRWNLETAVTKVIEWTKVYFAGGDVAYSMESQINVFLNEGIKNV